MDDLKALATVFGVFVTRLGLAWKRQDSVSTSSIYFKLLIDGEQPVLVRISDHREPSIRAHGMPSSDLQIFDLDSMGGVQKTLERAFRDYRQTKPHKFFSQALRDAKAVERPKAKPSPPDLRAALMRAVESFQLIANGHDSATAIAAQAISKIKDTLNRC